MRKESDVRPRSALRGRWAAVLVLSGLMLAGVGWLNASGDRDKDQAIRILWTNDLHGYVKTLYHREPWDADYESMARREGRLGGFAHIATLVKKLRGEKSGRTLLLDAGDTWHGTGVAVFDGGATVVNVMNALNYDAMAPGNVDFLFPKDVVMARVKQARFPVIAANWTDDDTGDPVVKPYVVKEVGGVKVGIIGMAYQWTAKTGDRSLTEGWSFGLKEKEVQEHVRELRDKEKVDLVLLLSHMGLPTDMKFVSRVRGIDAVIGAHTHDLVKVPIKVGGTLVCQAGSHGKNLGRLDLTVRNGKVVKYDHEVYRIVAKEIKADPGIQKIIDGGYAPYIDKLSRVIGQTKTMIWRRATWQNPMDNFISDVYREAEKADVAFSPAWRFGATTMPGDVRVEDVYDWIPAHGTVLTFGLTGQQIRSILESALDNILNDDPYLQLGGDLARFSGMEVVFDIRRPLGQRFVEIKIGGKPMDPRKVYRVASANTQFHNVPGAVDLRDTKKTGVDAVIAHIEKKKVIAPKLDDRVRNVPENDAPLREMEKRRIVGGA